MPCYVIPDGFICTPTYKSIIGNEINWTQINHGRKGQRATLRVNGKNIKCSCRGGCLPHYAKCPNFKGKTDIKSTLLVAYACTDIEFYVEGHRFFILGD